MLIDPSKVFFSAKAGSAWMSAITDMVNKGISSGVGISTPEEAESALSYQGWSDMDGTLHLSVLAPWGEAVGMTAPAAEWGLVEGRE